MTFNVWLHKPRMSYGKVLRFNVWEWRCCNYVWQLLISRKFTNREEWKPICPICGMKGE